MSKYYDILFLSEAAIGNTLEILYAVEYCIQNNVKVGIHINKCSKSFVDYLRR